MQWYSLSLCRLFNWPLVSPRWFITNIWWMLLCLVAYLLVCTSMLLVMTAEKNIDTTSFQHDIFTVFLRYIVLSCLPSILILDIQWKHRLEAEQRRLEEIGPIAYYSEWVEAYKNKDTSREAVQKHFEETGEDENTQLITMFQHQTAGEFRIMMGTDVRIQRDPLAMRMREDQIKQSISSFLNPDHFILLTSTSRFCWIYTWSILQ